MESGAEVVAILGGASETFSRYSIGSVTLKAIPTRDNANINLLVSILGRIWIVQ